MTDPEEGGYTIAMSAPPDDVDMVHSLLEQVWAGEPAVPAADRLRFETALIELTSNVIKHADSGSGVRCVLTVSVVDGRLHAHLSDTGEPGQLALSRRSMPDQDSESGRGLALIQALVDDLEYFRSEDFNHWRISRSIGKESQ